MDERADVAMVDYVRLLRVRTVECEPKSGQARGAIR